MYDPRPEKTKTKKKQMKHIKIQPVPHDKKANHAIKIPKCMNKTMTTDQSRCNTVTGQHSHKRNKTTQKASAQLIKITYLTPNHAKKSSHDPLQLHNSKNTT